MSLSTPADIQRTKDMQIVIKEGAKLRLKVAFRVNREIVMGLKFVNLVYRMGVRGMKPFRSFCNCSYDVH